jgi:hypothetical protein
MLNAIIFGGGKQRTCRDDKTPLVLKRQGMQRGCVSMARREMANQQIENRKPHELSRMKTGKFSGPFAQIRG